MAGESTYAGIAGLVANIYDIAVMSAQEGNAIAPFVTVFNQTGSAPRIFGAYSGGTFAAVAEDADMSAQAFNSSASGTITPATYGSQILLTERRIASDPANAQAEAGQYLGETASAHIDTNLAGVFASLTGGTVGTAGGTLTWANILRAQAYLRTNKVFGRYTVVVHPVQWYYLTSASSGVPTFIDNPNLKESVINGFYQASFGNMDFLADANIASGTAAVAGMFAKPAIVLDMRRPFTINPQWDASYSGSGGWELNSSMEYGYGVYRPTYGVKMIGTSV
jgi:hypothetical protein